MIYHIGKYSSNTHGYVTYALAKNLKSARSIAYDLAKMNLSTGIFVSNGPLEKMLIPRDVDIHSEGYALCSDETRRVVTWSKYIHKDGRTGVKSVYRLRADGSLGKKRDMEW